MALTREFKELVVERAKRDEEFRLGLLAEAVSSLLSNDIEIAKILLRDYINATVGFIELSKEISITDKSLMRMLSQKGNPRTSNLMKIIHFLIEMEELDLDFMKRA